MLNNRLADTRVVPGDPWPSFRTLPDGSTMHDLTNNPRGLFNLSFSLCVGASQDPKQSGGQYTDPPAWTTLDRRFGGEVMFHIMDGDYTYEQRRDGTLGGIRANYRLYMDRSGGMSRFMRYTPWLQMFDDHEVHDNLSYAYPQVMVTWYDGYTGLPAYSETVSTLDLQVPPER